MSELVRKLEFSVPEDFMVFMRGFRKSAESNGLEVDPELGWLAFKPETAVGSDGKEYLRKAGSQIVYVKTERGYDCVGCDERIQSSTVHHPIWDGPFEGAGSGRVYNEENVPYCPKCEEGPNLRGTPIRARW